MSNWLPTPENETFAEAMASKPAEKADLPDLGWYVVSLACASLGDRLDCGKFLFDLKSPGVEIERHFAAQTAPLEAARIMFSRRH